MDRLTPPPPFVTNGLTNRQGDRHLFGWSDRETERKKCLFRQTDAFQRQTLFQTDKTLFFRQLNTNNNFLETD